MKILIELIGGVIIGVLAALIMNFMDIDLTAAQTGIIIGSIVFITTIMQEITNAINKKISKKE